MKISAIDAVITIKDMMEDLCGPLWDAAVDRFCFRVFFFGEGKVFVATGSMELFVVIGIRAAFSRQSQCSGFDNSFPPASIFRQSFKVQLLLLFWFFSCYCGLFRIFLRFSPSDFCSFLF